MSTIVALNRDRDSYEVAASFAEVGRLEALVTDYYVGAGHVPVPGLAHRRHDLIDASLVEVSWPAFARQLPYEARRRLGPVDFPTLPVEHWLGRTAARVAARHPRADLVLYSGAARQAFEGPSTGRRVLFQYHPSPGFVEASLRGVDDLADERPWADEAEVGNAAMRDQHLAEVGAADHVLCASSFTRRGLIDTGVDPGDITVVPYGCPLPSGASETSAPDAVEFLFVGQGIRRKGLHLLIEAWRRAALTDARLTVVASRRLDPHIKAFAEGVPGITFRRDLSRSELVAAMREADTVILPSLVEGFGLVLGEALGCGARLIASDHTGLPDLQLPAELGTVVRAGSVADLEAALVTARDTADPGRPYRHAAVAAARERSWASFRQGIRDAAGGGRG